MPRRLAVPAVVRSVLDVFIVLLLSEDDYTARTHVDGRIFPPIRRARGGVSTVGGSHDEDF